MTGVIYHPKVPREVREIIHYYDGISPKLGDAIWEELLEAIQKAKDHPERNHYDPSGRRRCNLKRFPYHFLYREFSEGIRVTAVRHNKLDPNFGARRQ